MTPDSADHGRGAAASRASLRHIARPVSTKRRPSESSEDRFLYARFLRGESLFDCSSVTTYTASNHRPRLR